MSVAQHASLLHFMNSQTHLTASSSQLLKCTCTTWCTRCETLRNVCPRMASNGPAQRGGVSPAQFQALSSLHLVACTFSSRSAFLHMSVKEPVRHLLQHSFHEAVLPGLGGVLRGFVSSSLKFNRCWVQLFVTCCQHDHSLHCY